MRSREATRRKTDVGADLLVLLFTLNAWATKRTKDFYGDLCGELWGASIEKLYTQRPPTFCVLGSYDLSFNVHSHISAKPPCAAGYEPCFVTQFVRLGSVEGERAIEALES